VSQIREITIALAGNPNSGKTSIFNALTGARQKVANFPGVTVEKRYGKRRYNGYDITFVDLPGIYSLTPYSPEERVARDFIINERPELVISVIDSGNLERGLYLTMQFIEMGIDVIIDLNMWDEAVEAGIEIDSERLSLLLGCPVVKTVGNRAQGVDALLESSLSLLENREKFHRHPPISYGSRLDDVVADLSKKISICGACKVCQNPRWMAVKLLEGDADVRRACLRYQRPEASIQSELENYLSHIRKTTNRDPEVAFSEGRYGYVAGIIREIQKKPPSDRMKLSTQIDNFVTHRYWGYPIFLLLVWLIFQATFKVGAYPMQWIDAGVELLKSWSLQTLPSGFLSDLVADGVIGGVGSVIVFLPNIVLLFMGIAILEDLGYMARAAFLMDRLMHFLGLHGKSFVPLLMGFGCNVPAIMAARTLESPRDRILTVLLIPLMSCSARLPVYILFAGAFFPENAANVIFLIYLLGIVAAVIIARLFRKTILRPDDAPFVMELPPYRWPTVNSVIIHMWERSKIYLRKMGGVILVASIILWFLGNFPQKTVFSQDYDGRISALSTVPSDSAQAEIRRLSNARASEELEYSFIGRIGKAARPLFTPLGFTWEMGVSLITGFVAKEIVVSTMGVLYNIGEKTESLKTILGGRRDLISPLSAFAFMIFVLFYTPCMPTIFAIKREIGVKWMWFAILFQAAIAWIAAFVIYQGGRLLGL
jgi:ferrous iron transport protein B